VENNEFKKRALEFYKDEVTDMTFYDKLSSRIQDPEFKGQLQELSNIEKEHAGFWKHELQGVSQDVSNIGGKGLKISLLLLLMRLLGPVLTIRMLEHGELRAIRMYREMIDGEKEESPLKKQLQTILDQEINHEDIFANQISKTEEAIERSRDIIYGMSDGLVEVLGSVAGLTAIMTSHYYIALGGFVVAISGAMSMSLGSYLSEKTQNEYKIHQIEKASLFSPNRQQRSRIDELHDRSKKSAITTAFYYLIGAAIAILPFVAFARITALIVSVSLVAITQAITNSIVALSMNARVLRSAIRSAILTLLTAGATYLVGEIFVIFFHISIL
jgi:predicted membrane protein (TIGR00267 family)